MHWADQDHLIVLINALLKDLVNLICCVGNMQILLDNMAYADDDEALQDGDVRY